MAETSHHLVRTYYPPVYGDRPEPWELTFTCGLCGEELWNEQEGYGSTVGTPEEALERHIEELTQGAAQSDALV